MGSSRAKVGAIALATERIETVRGMPYSSIGTAGGIPSGTIPQSESVSQNGISYTRRTFITYVDDPGDGVGSADQNALTADYKKVKVELSWQMRGITQTFAMVSNFAPPAVESITNGGTLKVTVYNAASQPIEGASVHITNAALVPSIDVTTYTDETGQVIFPGGTPVGSGYHVVVTKPGYSTAQTYDASVSNPNPNPSNLSVAVSQTTSATFAIDTLSTIAIRSWKQATTTTFADTFATTNSIANTQGTALSGDGAIILNSDENGYVSSGTVTSIDITPNTLSAWKTLSFSTSIPANTTAKISVLYKSGTSTYSIIPDSDLPGNAAGFTSAPSSLNTLATSTYQTLRLKATLTSTDPAVTPRLTSWSLSNISGPFILPNIAFNMRGNKTIGSNAGGMPLYKYSSTQSTSATGTVSVIGLEWDTYIFTFNGSTNGYDLAEACPALPLSLAPNTLQALDLTFATHTTRSLLASVLDTNRQPVSNATVQLFDGSSTTTHTSSNCGATFFDSLSGTAAYTITASKSGYDTSVVTVGAVNANDAVNIVLPISTP